MAPTYPCTEAPDTGSQAPRPIVWLIGFFAFLNVYSMQSVLPLVMDDFGATPVQAGMTVGATILAIALVSPFMGMLSDALGRKAVLCTSLFVLTLPTALIPAADSLGIVIFLRFLQGLAVPGIVVVMMAYLAEEFRTGSVARMTTVYVGGTVMGGFCGRFITGHAGNFLGWRGAFITLAVINFIGALLVLWKLPASRYFIPNRNVRGALQSLASHLHNRRLIAACAVGFCALFSLAGTFTYVNLHLAAPPFELSASGLANVFCVYLMGVVVTPFTGRFIERIGFQRSLLSALAMSATGLMATLSPSLTVIIIGLTACASGVFICQSVAISFIAGNVSEGKSLAMGLYNMCYYAGGATATWVAGIAYENWLWSGSVMSIAAIQIVAALIAWFGWRNPDAAKG